MTKQSPGPVKSAERTLAILDLLTRTEGALTFSELAAALGYPQSSLHGLLRTLDGGWVEFDPTTRRYALGIRAWEAGNAYLRAVDLAERARPHLTRIRDSLGETVQLAVLDGRYNVYVAKVDGVHALKLASEVGRRLEAHATGVGKVLLAGLPTEELERRFRGVELERFTPRTITDLPSLLRELDVTRHRGYAEDQDEYTIGVHCLAVPVLDHRGEVTAAISTSVPAVRFDADLRTVALSLLQEARRALSAELGYVTPEKLPQRAG